jgi:hypothetical protein
MTGHFTSYETRTNHELATTCRTTVASPLFRANIASDGWNISLKTNFA